ncbi:MAG: hypothetical protein M3356_01790 [Actinomycetota bacterium]|nr:hypothetical protein [Actinomycetota bacterium]
MRFEITEPLVAAAYCRCTRCQRRSGTAVQASAKIAPGSFALTMAPTRTMVTSP